jgi:hypothetical protein
VVLNWSSRHLVFYNENELGWDPTDVLNHLPSFNPVGKRTTIYYRGWMAFNAVDERSVGSDRFPGFQKK